MATKKKDPDEAGDDTEKKGGKMKLILIIVPVLLLVVGAAVYFLVLKPSSDSTAAAAAAAATAAADGSDPAATDGAESTPTSTFVEGKVVVVADKITINLANGHYLSLGLALQATADAGEDVPTAKAIDAAITEFSGKTVDELATAEGREAARKELTKAVKKAYDKKVYEVYYTGFVMN